MTMLVFQDIQDVEEWLEPMSYIQLFEAAAPYAIFDDSEREHFDGLIAGGAVKQDLILSCLKIAVRLAMTEKFGLEYRVYEPMLSEYVTAVH